MATNVTEKAFEAAIKKNRRSRINKIACEDAGITFQEEDCNGKSVPDADKSIANINDNWLSEHFHRKFDVVLHSESRFYIYRDNVWNHITEFSIKKLLRNYFNKITGYRWYVGYENRYLSAFRLDCVDSGTLMSGDNYINFQNGLLDLGNGYKFSKHDRNVFTTSQLPVNYNQEQNAEHKELINVFQEIVGYALCNHTKAQKIFVFKGMGSNGKSVLCEVICALLGFENVSNISLSSMSNPFELAEIVGKKANICSENELNGKKLPTETA